MNGRKRFRWASIVILTLILTVALAPAVGRPSRAAPHQRPDWRHRRKYRKPEPASHRRRQPEPAPHQRRQPEPAPHQRQRRQRWKWR